MTPDKAGIAGTGSPTGSNDRTGQPGVLNLYLADTRELFNSMDPAPFFERDIDPVAAAYIIDWAREVPKEQPLQLRLRLGSGTPTPEDAGMLSNSIHDHFQRRALATRRELRQLLRLGRYSLLIALVFLAVVIIISESVASLISRERIATLIEDSFVIGGWVALWRPLEIFLYDWWPIQAEARLFERLSTMDVRTLGVPAAGTNATDGAAP